mmetsp:Transcript_68271/g.154469  ORF Transcript_68271/g.154469 Transcript_68271/m.154469 type:complete len:215 (+) Transcript_68271:317-961(+)|eukprot:CAMPEP_0172641586 /NCGR_PEP_ID=MMETSP1068-20121228/228064_1 /TAXON_ID=35684 /ORGANISM="Pseudopedinella elastica, Strain CCMP716" /LENGTH=214 /DNA_ID=CAMNT_0013455205 /DNA_START=223 /DNA_END=867 /DNA_ORIENTATION=+
MVLEPAEQTKTADAEKRMKNVGHVSGSVRDPALVEVLAVEDELGELARVDPLHLAHDLQRRQDPPRVAHVRLLLGPTVEPPGVALPLGEPPPEQRHVELLQPLSDGQSPDAAEDLPRMGLSPGDAPEPAVEVPARRHEIGRRLQVHQPARSPACAPAGSMQTAEEGESAERAVGEPRVHLAPPVPRERPVRLLERRQVSGDLVRVDAPDRVQNC